MIKKEDFNVETWGNNGERRQIFYKPGTFGTPQKYGRKYELVEFGAKKDRDMWVFLHHMWDNERYSIFRYYGRWSPKAMDAFINHIIQQKILYKKVFEKIFNGDWNK